jgi:hypothetical protein
MTKRGLPEPCLIKPMMRLLFSLGAGFVYLALTAGSEVETFSLATAGVRALFAANPKSQTFEQDELFAGPDLPWRWGSDSSWHLQTRLDLSAGALHGHSDTGFIGSVGTDFGLRHGRFPVNLELGVSPTLLSRTEFDGMDFGIRFQFTSHAGLNWELGDHFGIGYRYQHMSNAHLSSHNPGLNLHGVVLYYRF